MDTGAGAEVVEHDRCRRRAPFCGARLGCRGGGKGVKPAGAFPAGLTHDRPPTAPSSGARRTGTGEPLSQKSVYSANRSPVAGSP